jgi:hypothetical protein
MPPEKSVPKFMENGEKLFDDKLFGETFQKFSENVGKFPDGKISGENFREIPGNSGKTPDGKISGETFGENSGKIYFLVNQICKNPGNRVNPRCSELLTLIKSNENRRFSSFFCPKPVGKTPGKTPGKPPEFRGVFSPVFSGIRSGNGCTRGGNSGKIRGEIRGKIPRNPEIPGNSGKFWSKKGRFWQF